MMKFVKSSKFVLPATLVAALALSTAGAMAGKGGNGGGNSGDNGGGNGGGNSGGNSSQSASASGEDTNGKSRIRGEKGSGLHPSELKKVNGALNANSNAMKNASNNSVHGLARTVIESSSEIAVIDGQLVPLKDQLLTLTNEVTFEDYQTQIDNLDDTSPTYAADKTALEELRDVARTDAQVAADVGTVTGQIGTLEAQKTTLQAAYDEALQKLNNGEELHPDVLAELKEKLESL
jgi:predicted  nucleic acid-binding Zn-ribbon protein